MRVLFTFIGSHDPVSHNLLADVPMDGPVLTLAHNMRFDHIALLATPDMQDRARETEERLKRFSSPPKTEMRVCALADPTSHLEIIRFLRQVARETSGAMKTAECYAAVASGTPQMHACWLLLAASAEVPLTLLQLRNPRYVTVEQPLITALDFSQPEFPRVIPNILDEVRLAGTEDADIRAAAKQAGILGEHPDLYQALKTARKVAQSGIIKDILILGETGAGKERLARFVHACSGRKGEFVPFNCAALTESVAESELFGHVKGAFTGAALEKDGLFHQALQGTLFIDEIGDLPLGLQAKLLRALQERKIRRLGATTEESVNALIVTATNVDLKSAIREKRFRQDLYERLNGITLTLPPLRKRRSDIPRLAMAFLESAAVANKRPLSGAALAKLQRYAWPGNIRELQNVICRAALLCEKDIIDANDIVFDEDAAREDPFSLLPEPGPGFDLKEYIAEINRRLKQRALEIADGNLSRAAAMLGISRAALCKDQAKKKRSG